MNGGPTNDEILEAVRESGYLMEQHVATQLEALGFKVRTNVPFQHQDEGKSREIDVTAVKRMAMNEEAKVSAYVELLVECKNGRNPFVFITRSKDETDFRLPSEQFCYPTSYVMKKDLGAGRGLQQQLDGFFHLGFANVHYGHLEASKAVQFCRIDRKGGGWHANHGGLYDAMFYPMAKAVTARLAEIPRGRQQSDWKYLWLMFPIVVTSGDVMTIDSMAELPSPEQRDWVRFSRDLKGGPLNGSYGLDFVRQGGLERFVRDCIDPLSHHAKGLVEDRLALLLQSSCPWEEPD